MVHPSTCTTGNSRAPANFARGFTRVGREIQPNRKSEQESRSPGGHGTPTVADMCFMFGASEEQVRRVLEEARQTGEEVPVEVEDCPED
ncbi:hypothetical protein GCM10011609_17450 [Lentzea pudingi]|uniref:DUF3606 domain-containing protein n=1 Tax=Lentzea pudingi TaxID=1789439 RepID=A0ABQ2HHM4_9PSEU|nr:hypothetical protein GCM10011609_17450 [Lentzea pudingi]